MSDLVQTAWTRTRKLFWLGLVFLLIAVAFVGFSQRFRYQRENFPLAKRLRDSRNRLEMAQVAAARLDEFRREFTKRESELADLRRKLPSELEVESFIVLLEEWAGESGVSVEVRNVESESGEI